MTDEYNPDMLRCSNELCGGEMVVRRNRSTGAWFLSCRKCAKTRSISREDIGRLRRQGVGAQMVLELTEQRLAELERRAATLRPGVNQAATAGRFSYDNTHTRLEYNRELGGYIRQGAPDWEAIRLQCAWQHLSTELELIKQDLAWLCEVAAPAVEIAF